MPPSDYPTQFLNVDIDGDTAVVRFKPARLTDEDNIERLGHELFGLVDQQQMSRVLLNLDGVEMMTSSVLGKLITLHRRLHRSNGMLVICGAGAHVSDILKTSRLHDYFNVAADPQAASQMLGRFGGDE